MTIKLNLFLSIFILILFTNKSSAQNLDFGFINSSGKYRSMAGAGIGMIEGISAIDLNPGGLIDTHHKSISLSQSVDYYSYNLYRLNENVGAVNFDWDITKYNIDNILIALPIKKNIVLGMGCLQKTKSYTVNNKRALTWSHLFNQTTRGNIYALTFSSSYRINNKLSVGISFYKYLGTITSKVRGENHGNDTSKWATLKNKFSGINCKVGLIFKTKQFRTGLIIEAPGKLNVNADKSISKDKSYNSLLPNYDHLKYEMPLILGVGFAYTGFKDILFTMDFETRQYKKSDLQINLFEFGGRPNWENMNIFRLGTELFPFNVKKNLPLRLGYGYIPQLYASNNSTGYGNDNYEYIDSDQNVKHLLTIGTTLKFQNFLINLSFEHTILHWHRNLNSTWYVKDDYSEKIFIFSTEIIYNFQ